MTGPRVIYGLIGLTQLIGQEVGVSDWIVVSQQMIDQFAGLTGDHQWIHVDVDRATRESPFKKPIAHGFLTMSLMSNLLHEAVDVRGDFRLTVNYGFNKLRFPSPVPAGSRVRARVAVNAVRELDGAAEIAWGILLEIEDHPKPAVAAEWLTRMYFR